MAISLVAKLGLDGSGFNSGMKDAIKQMNYVEKATKTMGSSLSSATDKGRLSFKSLTASINANRQSLDLARNSSANYGASLGTLAAGIMTVVGAQKTLNATVGEAMKLDYNKVSLQAMFAGDAKAANELSKFIENKALNSVMSYQDALSATQSFATTTKNTKDIKEMVNLTERLSYLNPLEGFQGAGFAIKESLGGDLVSLKDRFNLTSNQLTPLKEAATQAEKLKALDKILNDIGISTKYLDTVNNTTYAKWNKLTDTTRQFFVKLGESALTSVSPMIDKLTKFMEGEEFAGFQAKAGAAFGALFQNIGQFATTLYDNRAQIAEFANGAITVLTDVGNAAKSFATFFVENWSTIKPVLAGVAAGLIAVKVHAMALSIIGMVTSVLGGLKKALALARGAMLAFNMAMRANPIGLVITAIGLLVTAGIHLYKNWDTVKVQMAKTFDGIKLAAEKSINFIIGGINDMIETINKIPGVNIPIVPKVNWSQADTKPPKSPYEATKLKPVTPNVPQIKLTGIGVNGSYYHGLDRVPYDGFIAKLHRNERVLTAQENKAFNKLGGLNGLTSPDRDSKLNFNYEDSARLGGRGSGGNVKYDTDNSRVTQKIEMTNNFTLQTNGGEFDRRQMDQIANFLLYKIKEAGELGA
ncbi:hypothetical protein [Bacillus sp. JJ722]|uniref:hypothetical protein n=1 Tax=Bacillus sp. JJ722 TaxID=3122973 RepID=UPI002FFEC818